MSIPCTSMLLSPIEMEAQLALTCMAKVLCKGCAQQSISAPHRALADCPCLLHLEKRQNLLRTTVEPSGSHPHHYPPDCKVSPFQLPSCVFSYRYRLGLWGLSSCMEREKSSRYRFFHPLQYCCKGTKCTCQTPPFYTDTGSWCRYQIPGVDS